MFEQNHSDLMRNKYFTLIDNKIHKLFLFFDTIQF